MMLLYVLAIYEPVYENLPTINIPSSKSLKYSFNISLLGFFLMVVFYNYLLKV